MVRVGLLLAERHFPRWAQSRLRIALEEMRRHETTSRAPQSGARSFRAAAPGFAH
jgi:hypothetical protein